jgi:hypothetical protein
MTKTITELRADFQHLRRWRKSVEQAQMLVGVALSAVIWRLQAYLLRWQQHNMAE